MHAPLNAVVVVGCSVVVVDEDVVVSSSTVVDVVVSSVVVVVDSVVVVVVGLTALEAFCDMVSNQLRIASRKHMPVGLYADAAGAMTSIRTTAQVNLMEEDR